MLPALLVLLGLLGLPGQRVQPESVALRELLVQPARHALPELHVLLALPARLVRLALLVQLGQLRVQFGLHAQREQPESLVLLHGPAFGQLELPAHALLLFEHCAQPEPLHRLLAKMTLVLLRIVLLSTQKELAHSRVMAVLLGYQEPEAQDSIPFHPSIAVQQIM